METKKFLGLPVINSVNLPGLLKNWLSIILFTGVSYFIISLILGLLKNDAWLYIQSETPYYLIQLILLFLGVLFGHIIRVILNNIDSKFFICKKIDLLFYIIGFIITYLIIIEIL